MYKLLRNILFWFDAEDVHYFSMNTLKFLCRIPLFKNIIRKQYSASEIHSETAAFNLSFKNPVGLGAGFDKNAKYLNELEALGFGFVEIGTVTPLPQAGNEKPRLFRLPKDRALINRMGFNNDGVEAVAERLKTWRTRNSLPRLSGEKRETTNAKACSLVRRSISLVMPPTGNPTPLLILQTLDRGHGLLGLRPCGPVIAPSRTPLFGARGPQVTVARLQWQAAAGKPPAHPDPGLEIATLARPNRPAPVACRGTAVARRRLAAARRADVEPGARGRLH